MIKSAENNSNLPAKKQDQDWIVDPTGGVRMDHQNYYIDIYRLTIDKPGSILFELCLFVEF